VLLMAACNRFSHGMTAVFSSSIELHVFHVNFSHLIKLNETKLKFKILPTLEKKYTGQKCFTKIFFGLLDSISLLTEIFQGVRLSMPTSDLSRV